MKLPVVTVLVAGNGTSPDILPNRGWITRSIMLSTTRFTTPQCRAKVNCGLVG